MTIASAPTKPYAIGETLREWRLTARLSIDDLAVLLHEKAPTLRRNSREFIRRYEIGSVAIERLDVAYLIVIAELLGHDARELGPDIAELVDLLSTVLAKPERPRPRRRGHSVKDL